MTRAHFLYGLPWKNRQGSCKTETVARMYETFRYRRELKLRLSSGEFQFSETHISLARRTAPSVQKPPEKIDRYHEKRFFRWVMISYEKASRNSVMFGTKISSATHSRGSWLVGDLVATKPAFLRLLKWAVVIYDIYNDEIINIEAVGEHHLSFLQLIRAINSIFQ